MTRLSRWGELWLSIAAVVLAAAVTPSAALAQILVGPARLKAAAGVDTSDLARAIEDAVWHGVVRQRAIVYDLKSSTRSALEECDRKVGCIANAGRDARVKLVLMPFVSQERDELVVRVYVITSERPRIITLAAARWPTQRATVDLRTAIEKSLGEIAPILRGEKLSDTDLAERARSAPDGEDERESAGGETTEGAAAAGPGAGSEAEARAAKPKPSAKAGLAAWAQAARDRAAVNGGFAILVHGDTRPQQIAELIQRLGDAIEERTGLAPVLDQENAACTSFDHCARDVLDRTHTMELVLLGAKRRGKGATVHLTRRGRRDATVSRAMITIPRAARSKEPTIPELARAMFPEGRDLTPEIPEIPE